MNEAEIRFDSDGTLMLAPAETTTLRVFVDPPLRQTVTFEILSEDEGFDGFLHEANGRVTDEGTATVELQAPSRPSIFIVRASLDAERQVTRAISVSASGYGTLVVVPRYYGKRAVTQWTASARTGTTCDAISSDWSDGPLVATGSQKATISGVPAGPPIALTLRGGQVVSGCTTVLDLMDGDDRTIEIEVTDRPVDLTQGMLELTLGVDSMGTEFASHLDAAVALGVASLGPIETTDAVALLQTMTGLLEEDEAEAFSSSSQYASFPTVVRDTWSVESPIRQAIGDLLTTAGEAITGDAVFVGTLTLDGTQSSFDLVSAASIPTSVSGFFQGSTWSVTSEPGDTLVIGGELTYEPLRWLASIAEKQSESGADTALESAVGCEEVAAALVLAASGPPHGDCTEACLEALCREAAVQIWQEVTVAGDGLSTLQVGISGDMTLTSTALVNEMDGAWVGRREEEETSLKGPARATRIISP